MIKEIDTFVEKLFSPKNERLSLINKLERSHIGLLFLFVLVFAAYVISDFFDHENSLPVLLCFSGLFYVMNSSTLYLAKVADRFLDELESNKDAVKQPKSNQSAEEMLQERPSDNGSPN